MNDTASAPCPMPGCDDPLYLTWTLGFGLLADDLRAALTVGPQDAETSSWSLGCTAGHVLLLPEDDEQQEDWRPLEDWRRLLDLVRRIGGAS